MAEQKRQELINMDPSQKEDVKFTEGLLKELDLQVCDACDFAKTRIQPKWLTLIGEVFLQEDAAIDTLAEIREAFPLFMEGITDTSLLNVSLHDFANKWKAPFEAYLSGEKVKSTRPLPPQRMEAEIPTSSLKRGEFSQLSVLAKLAEYSQDAQYLVSQLRGVDQWDGKRFAAAWSIVQSQISRLDPAKPMGVLADMTDEEIISWQQDNQKAVITVGPYILMKVLNAIGLQSTSYEDKVAGSWMRWSRNGVDIASNDRRAIQLDGEYGTPDAEDQAWAKFLRGLDLQKRRLKFRDIHQDAYSAADLLLTYWVVKRDGATKKVICTLNKENTIRDAEVAAYITRLKERVLEHIFYSVDADWIMETIAMIAHDELPPTAAVLKYLAKKRQEVGMRVETVTNQLVAISAEKDLQKRDVMLTKVGATTDISVAITKMGEDRKFRNVCDASQYVSKNCGSVGGDNMPQQYDTLLKGFRLVNIMKAMGALRNPNDEVHVYGIAYGHMAPVFKREKALFKYFDTTKATRSTADYAWGDVYTSNGKFIIDDTHIKIGPGGRVASGVETYDYMKVKHHLENPNLQAAVIKISGDSFSTIPKATAMSNLLKAQTRFHYVQLAKVGKLHNAEVFLFLSAVENVKPRKRIVLDLKSVAQCISVANEMISDAHRQGLRLKQYNERGRPLVDLWRGLVAAVPADWVWYNPIHSKDNPLVVGKVYDVLDISPDAVSEYEEDTFAVWVPVKQEGKGKK